VRRVTVKAAELAHCRAVMDRDLAAKSRND